MVLRAQGVLDGLPAMPRPLVSLVLVLLLGAPCSAVAAPTTQRPDLLRHFTDAGTTGTIVVQRSGPKPRTWVAGASRGRRPYIPSSTFKVPNALLAIDRGIVSGTGEAFPGPHPNVELDGAPLLPAACEDDLTLGTALALSCIPIFQRLARSIGRRAYERDLRRLRYGDADLDGAQVDRFWLDGPLRVTAHEQARFALRLARRTLPVRRRAMDEVAAALVVERGRCGVLHGKTGYVFTTKPRVGWWVGWLRKGRTTWAFALNLDVTRPEHLAARTTIGRAVLADLGATSC